MFITDGTSTTGQYGVLSGIGVRNIAIGGFAMNNASTGCTGNVCIGYSTGNF